MFEMEDGEYIKKEEREREKFWIMLQNFQPSS